MESSEVKWLKSVFREATYDAASPSPKRVKFSELSFELEKEFPQKNFTPHKVSQLAQEAFPNTVSKACGTARQKHLLGLERISAGECPEPTRNDLLRRIEELEDEVKELRKTSEPVLCSQADNILQSKSAIAEGPSSIDEFQALDFQSILDHLRSQAPDLYGLFMSLGSIKRNAKEDEVTTEQTKAVASLCSILNARSARVNGLQLLVSMMLVARATSKQAIAVLSHTGVCMSYTAAWSHILKLTEDAKYRELVQAGHWLWVYDNVNIHQSVRHERGDNHSAMLNLTARLGVQIQILPDWEVDWNDSTPQRPRSSLDSSDFLVSMEEASSLIAAAVQYTMEFLVEEFDSLKELKPFVPSLQCPHIRKPTVAPMPILFKDEKYKDQTIDIIRQLMEDAKLSGNPQVVIGDQLTCKNIRAMKAWTLSETEKKFRLQWAHEVPGDFHFLWECLRVIFIIFWGSPTETGSLCSMREFINRKLVTKNVKVFSIGDEFLVHTFKAHFMASICTILNINSPASEIPHTTSLDWLQTLAKDLVKKTIFPASSPDCVYTKHRAFLHLAFMYIDLRRAIRWERGAHVVLHWKFWLPRFIGTGCKNYVAEAINLIAHLQADFPKHIAYIAMHNRTVNTTGKPGHGKPIDQLMEHYVLVMKQSLRSSGGKASPKRIIDVSMSAPFLLEAAKKCDQLFGVPPPSTCHNVRDAIADINKVLVHLMECGIPTENKNRTTPPFKDPTENGIATLCKGDWLQKRLSSTEVEPEEEQERYEIELDYELSDVV